MRRRHPIYTRTDTPFPYTTLFRSLPVTEDRIVGVLPLFHVFANTCVLNRTVANRGCMVLLPRFHAGQVLSTLDRTAATALPGVPTMSDRKSTRLNSSH